MTGASRGLARLALLAIFASASACSDVGTIVPLGPILTQGAFAPTRDIVAFAAKPGERDNPALWEPRPAVAVSGWGRELRGWRPVGASSTLDLRRRRPDADDLMLELRRRRSATDELRMTVLVNGEPVGKTTLGPGITRGRHPVPPARLSEVNRVELRFDPPLEQSDVGAVALSLTRAGFLPAGAPDKRPGAETVGAVVEPERSEVTFLESGVYLLPLTIPPEASFLALESRASASDEPTDHRLWALELDGRRRELSLESIDPGDPGWATGSADLEGLRGKQVFLGIEVELPDAGAGLTVRGLRIGLDRRPGEASEPPGGPAPDPPPDVVLIVLDAARADRFDGRYPRDLTPRLDNIRPESLVFEHAYSECPNTVCSIPNLITGRSFLNTGDVYEGVRLSDQVVTLAESLASAGYTTVGLSANPNNSSARNGDQGFDVWRGLWGPRWDRGALGVSEVAAEIIAGQDAGTPLFLQLHYLEPHQPYSPPPEFDLFTDPDYEGPVKPGEPVDETELGPEDLAQLVALYDGNLRLADEAVGRVIEAMRAAGRWDNTLLVLTSDHGEAFLEHDLHGHNSSLFDEMLHVPLVIRLPQGERPESVDTTRLAAVSDVVPTVLGHLGLAPAPETNGIDLLATRPDPDRQRIIFHRTNHRQPLLSARGRSWKLIARPAFGIQMLFDLVEDPGETTNRAPERPSMYMGLGLLLREHLETAARSVLDADGVHLDAESREVLESLGYVD